MINVDTMYISEKIIKQNVIKKEGFIESNHPWRQWVSLLKL